MNKVLVYHTICEPREALPSNIDVSEALFDLHLRWLGRRRDRVVALREMITESRSGDRFAITFDDGYADNLTVALPLLEKYELPMTLFAVAGFIGNKGYLTESELRTMADHPLVTIGSHAMTHRHLSRMADADAMAELGDSKRLLEKITGKEVDLLAYPYGDCGVSTEKLAEKCGYKAAWTIWNGTNTPFSRWRIPLGRNDGMARFVAKVSPAYFPIKKLLRPPEVLA